MKEKEMKRAIYSLLTVCMIAGLASAGVVYETTFSTAEGYVANGDINNQLGWSIAKPAGETLSCNNILPHINVFILTPHASDAAGASVSAYRTVDTANNTTVTFKSTMQFSAANSGYGATADAYLSSGATTGPKASMSAAGGFYCTNGAGTTQILSSVTGSAWYTFEMTIDMINHTYDISVTDPNSAVTTVTGLSFDSGISSFDKLSLEGWHNKVSTLGETASAYNFVELSAVPEPATMALLGLGGAAALIRRKRK